MLNIPFRSYPVAFGLRILRYLPQLRASSMGWPPVLGNSEPDGLSLFKQMPIDSDSWSEVLLGDAVAYIRGSIHLKLPQHWKSAFPTEI